jgi:hypothetical protein
MKFEASIATHVVPFIAAGPVIAGKNLLSFDDEGCARRHNLDGVPRHGLALFCCIAHLRVLGEPSSALLLTTNWGNDF